MDSVLTASRLHSSLMRGVKTAVFTLIAWLPAIVIILPLCLLFRTAISVTADSRGITGFAFDAFVKAWQIIGAASTFSVQVALLSAVTTVVLAVPIAYAIRIDRGTCARCLQSLVSFPIIFPAFLLGMGVMMAYPVLQGSFWIVYLAYVALGLPYAIWPMSTALQLIDVEALNIASRTLGASPLQRMRMIIVPNMIRPAMVGGVTVYASFLAESSASFFLASAEHQPLGVAIYNTFQDVDTRVAAAAIMIYLALLVGPLLAMELCMRKTLSPTADAARDDA